MATTTTQNPLIGGAYQTLQKLGRSFSAVPVAPRAPRPTGVNKKYQALSSGVQGFAGRSGQKLGNLGTLTVPYGGGTKYEGFHPGIDIGNAEGTKIPALAGGRVTEVVGGKRHGDAGFGNYVIVTDASGAQHRYSHLKQAYVKMGQQLKRGQALGEIGATGQTYSASGQGPGAHLDYRIKDAYGKYVNPFSYLSRLAGTS